MEIKNINEASEKLQEALIIRNNALKIGDINIDNVEKVRKLFENVMHYYYTEIEKGNLEAMKGFCKVLEEGVFNDEEIEQFYIITKKNGYTNIPYCYSIMQYFQLNKEKITEYIRAAAEKHNIEASYIYALILLEKDPKISENKREILKYFKIAADGGHIGASFYYAITLLNYEEECVENLEKSARYLKIAAKNGHREASYSYAKALRSGLKGFKMNKKKAIKYYKIAVDNGYIPAVNKYAEMLENGEGIEKNLEEAKRYYKIAIEMENLDFLENENPNKKLFSDLLKEYNEYIFNVASEQEKYNNFKFEEGKIAAIIFDGETRRQGLNQVIIVRTFEYDENGNLTMILDTAIHRDVEERMLYGIQYNEDEGKTITYLYGNNEFLFEANISSEGELKFNFGEDFFTSNAEENKIKIRETKNKIREILDSFNNMKNFNNELSYLEYAILVLELNKGQYNGIVDNISIRTNCKNNMDNLLAIANESLMVENENKIFICNFSTGNHNIQVIISNGNFIVSNTGIKFKHLVDEAKIIETFNEKYPSNAGKLKINELSILTQTEGNCTETSKIQTINLITILLKDIVSNNKNKTQNITKDLMNYLDGLSNFIEKDIKDITDFNEFSMNDIFMTRVLFKSEIKILTNLKKTYLVATDKVAEIQEKFFKLAKMNEQAKEKIDEVLQDESIPDNKKVSAIFKNLINLKSSIEEIDNSSIETEINIQINS